MAMSFSLILLLLALMCFVLAALQIKSTRVEFIALGLGLWVVSLMVGGK